MLPCTCVGSYGQWRQPEPQQYPRLRWKAAVISRPFSRWTPGPRHFTEEVSPSPEGPGGSFMLALDTSHAVFPELDVQGHRVTADRAVFDVFLVRPG